MEKPRKNFYLKSLQGPMVLLTVRSALTLRVHQTGFTGATQELDQRTTAPALDSFLFKDNRTHRAMVARQTSLVYREFQDSQGYTETLSQLPTPKKERKGGGLHEEGPKMDQNGPALGVLYRCYSERLMVTFLTETQHAWPTVQLLA